MRSGPGAGRILDSAAHWLSHLNCGDFMAAWKQLLIACFLIACGALLWVRYFPGADEQLARWGMDWAVAAVPERASDTGAVQPQRSRGPQGSAVVEAVTDATINDRLSAIGTGRADASVAIKPHSTGRLTEILVEPGSRISRGTVIARLDSEAESIAVDRSRLALDDAEARLGRLTALRSSNTATAVQVTEAETAAQTARLALRDAELALERRSIPAPIDGIVGIIAVEVGNYVTSDTEIVRLEDRSSIIVDFWVPERYATAIAVGDSVSASSVARPDEVFEGRVSAVDNRLDQDSRTLLVRARIGNPEDRLRAGMSFQVSMRFPGNTFPAVNPLAIQWGTDGAFVWTLREGKAVRTPVRIIQRNTENVLVSGEIGDEDEVVIEGIHLARDGQPLNVRGRDATLQDPPTPVAAGT
jgi:RND family efflux transporter MFP subunit